MKRSTIFFVVFLAAGFFLLFPQANLATASNNVVFPPWKTAGTGTYFRVSGLSGAVSLDSSVAINLALESFPNMTTISFDATGTPTSAQITIGGFLPSTTYFKSQDGYNNEAAVVTDSNGAISFVQQIDSGLHIVIIQPNHSTTFIRNDSTGGDCTTVGNWDSSTATCTLNTNISGTVEIDGNNVTLDGNGHTISGGTIGVFLVGSSVTIENTTVSGFNSGIYSYNSNNNNFLNNNVSGNITGFYFSESGHNTIQNNTASNNSYVGISLDSFSGYNNNNNNNNNISGNTILNNSGNGIFIAAYGGNSTNSVIDSNVINHNSGNGISLGGSGNLVNYAITNNDIEENSGQGLNVPDTFSGNIYHNDIINNVNPTSVFPPSANLAFFQSLPIGGNHWSEFDTPVQGCVDSDNNGICDSSFIFTGGRDNFPWVAKSGWKLPIVSSLNQYKSDAITPITEGGITTENAVVFSAIPQLSSTDQLQLQVEYTTSTASSPFTGTPNGTSASVNPGSQATVTVSGLQEGNYRWQARAFDLTTGAASDWKEFGVAGNTDFVVQQSRDTTAPVITGLIDQTFEATGPNTTPVLVPAIATDAVDPNPTITYVPSSFPVGDTIVTWTATDASGNQSTATSKVTIQDTTAPAIFGTPETMTVEAISSSGADVSYTAPTATDLVDGTDAVTCLPASGSTFPLGTTAIICTSEDVAGNTATSTFDVKVQDTTAPVITVPIDQTFEATGASTTPALALVPAIATDAVDPNPTITYVPSSFPVGDTIVTWTATDASGNQSTATSKVTIQDTTAPVITLLGFDTVYSSINTPYIDAGATALDNVDGDITSKIVVANPVNISKIGSYTVTYNVVDSSGNRASQVVRTVKVTNNCQPPVDTIKPVIFLIGPNPQFVEVGTAYSERGAIILDNHDSHLIPTINASNINTSKVGSYIVTYNAVDSSGNRAIQRTRTVKVVDTIKPVIFLIGPNPQVIKVGTAYSELGATVSDNYDTGLTPIINASKVNTSKVGSYIVTYNAVDSSGNRANQHTRTVNVIGAKNGGGCHFGGFQMPIRTDGSGIYKLGRTLPIKFRLTDVDNNILTSVVAQLVVTKIQNGIAGTDSVILANSKNDTGNLFRVGGSQYIYNFDTGRLTPGTWQIKVVLDNGSSYTVPISLR